jgi:hypothetical protein
MDSPMTVSVVTPLYNARDVIRETIETVLAQTWNDYEIVVATKGANCRSHLFMRNGLSHDWLARRGWAAA